MLGLFCCLDNDIILKLVTYKLLEPTIQNLGISDKTQVKILDSFKYKFSKPINRNRGNRANDISRYDIEKALEIAGIYGCISESDIDINVYTQLLEYNKTINNCNNTIDKGEAILISYAYYLNQQGNNIYLLTGDKRCLLALANSGFTEIVKHLEGKVWCLEQLILKDIEMLGFDIVQAKIYTATDCDMNIKFIFGYSIESPEYRVKEDLIKEIADLRQKTDGLLYPYPWYNYNNRTA